MHLNPLSGNWTLAKDDLANYYSSARFYENGKDDFGFLHNCMKYSTGCKCCRFVCHEPGRGGEGG